MKLRNSPPPSEGDGDNPLEDATWLYSYADLVTQLLLFSILMVTAMGLDKIQPPSDAVAKSAPADPLESTRRELDRLVEKKQLGDAVALDRSADRLVIRMKSLLLFGEAQATLTQRANELLAQLLEILNKVPSGVRIEGHTDDVPIHTPQFASNWELSSARAISVARFLEEHGFPQARLSVAGYGEHHPIHLNDSPEHRAQNRRVEIVVLGE